jgi:hypothetical protein
MEAVPKIQEVQLIIDATRKLGAKAEQELEETQRFFAASYVPKQRVNDGELVKTRVARTVMLFSQNGGYEAFAIVNTSGGEAYEVKGWTVTTVSHGGDLKGDVADVIKLGEEIFLIANVDGGKVVSEEDCTAKLDAWMQQREQRKLQAQEESRLKQQQITVTRKVAERGQRLQRDEQSLKAFPELETFRSNLDVELLIQRELIGKLDFGQQTPVYIDELENELEKITECENANLTPMRVQATSLSHKLQRQREAQKQIEQKKFEEEQAKRRQLKEEENRKDQEKRKEQERQNGLKQEPKLQRTAATGGGGCILTAFAVIISAVLLTNRNIK